MIYTIGHSNHPAERFIALLRQHGIGVLADVRSTPFSRFNPQFNRERLAAALHAERIDYVFLGRELGARSQDPEHYEGGRVSYAKLARSEPFRRGLERVLAYVPEAHAAEARTPEAHAPRGFAPRTFPPGQRIALMCAERDPLRCHRTLLISPELVHAGVPVAHILADGSLETHGQLMQRIKPADPQSAFPFEN